MKPKTIRVLSVKVGAEPVVENLPNNLKAMQDFVGGYIEGVTLAPDVQLICNEEGKLIGLPMNRPLPDGGDIICGNFLILRIDDEGENASLTAKDIATFTVVFSLKRPEAHA